jgi:hypothetical protein
VGTLHLTFSRSSEFASYFDVSCRRVTMTVSTAPRAWVRASVDCLGSPKLHAKAWLHCVTFTIVTNIATEVLRGVLDREHGMSTLMLGLPLGVEHLQMNNTTIAAELHAQQQSRAIEQHITGILNRVTTFTSHGLGCQIGVRPPRHFRVAPSIKLARLCCHGFSWYISGRACRLHSAMSDILDLRSLFRVLEKVHLPP